MKILIYLIILFTLITSIYGLECKTIMQVSDLVNNCTATSLWDYGTCENYHLSVYNKTYDLVANYTYGRTNSEKCYINWSIKTIGSYSGYVENGDTVSMHIEGDTKMIGFGVIIFLIIFNIAVFLIPLVVRRFTDSKASDYIIKNLFWMGGILFLWFNTTIIRQMAEDAGVGIDLQLSLYWWFFTCLVVIIIFAMIYVTTVGAIKLSQEAQLQKRMGM